MPRVDREKLVVTARLWIRPGQRRAFDVFEGQAFEIMRRHKVRILQILSREGDDKEAPHEVHVLKFPSNEAFEAYRNDPDLLALADLRADCIAETQIEITRSKTERFSSFPVL